MANISPRREVRSFKMIYAIQHNVTRRIYIGSSEDVETRYMAHIYKLRAGKHPVEDMQSDFDEYGEDFSLFILEDSVDSVGRGKEYEWMRKYKTNQRGLGYNYNERFAATCKAIPLKDGLPQEPGDTEKA